MRAHRFVLPTLAAVAALALAGCGTGIDATGGGAASPGASGTGVTTSTPVVTATGSPATGAHNDADVTFATDMLPHHLSAIEMSRLAATRAGDATVRSLAAQIATEQDPEVTTMAGWLLGWGRAVPDASTGGDMSGMAGVMSPADMTSLARSTGAAFDRMWARLMTVHHQGAVTMSRTELTDGANPQAKALARSIIASQTAEIAQLQELLTRLPA